MYCICGQPMADTDHACTMCGRVNPLILEPHHKLIVEEISLKYGLKEETLVGLGNFDFFDQINDNCIIYQNGIVDSFEHVDDLVEALSGSDRMFIMSEMHEDIFAIIFDGKIANFSIVYKVDLIKIENKKLNIHDILSKHQINGDNHIILRDQFGTTLKFISPEKIAEWINKNGGEDISLIFIKEQPYEYVRYPVFKLNDIEIEIMEDIPF
jgi:hypothetical protein